VLPLSVSSIEERYFAAHRSGGSARLMLFFNAKYRSASISYCKIAFCNAQYIAEKFRFFSALQFLSFPNKHFFTSLPAVSFAVKFALDQREK
jgi:hypothetical protein